MKSTEQLKLEQQHPSGTLPGSHPKATSFATQNEALISKLHLSIRPLARKLIANASEAYVILGVSSGLRLSSEQAKLYAQGRTTPGPIVTNARPGTSWHNYGLAFDVAIIVDGKLTWPNDDILWTQIGELGEDCGLEWGGRFKTIVDRPHFEYRQGLSIGDAIAGKRPKV